MLRQTLRNIIKVHGEDFRLSIECSIRSYRYDNNPDYSVIISWKTPEKNAKILSDYYLHNQGAYIVRWKSSKPIHLKEFRGGDKYSNAGKRAEAYIAKLNKWAGK